METPILRDMPAHDEDLGASALERHRPAPSDQAVGVDRIEKERQQKQIAVIDAHITQLGRESGAPAPLIELLKKIRDLMADDATLEDIYDSSANLIEDGSYELKPDIDEDMVVNIFEKRSSLAKQLDDCYERLESEYPAVFGSVMSSISERPAFSSS